jgi:hypothetical protein
MKRRELVYPNKEAAAEARPARDANIANVALVSSVCLKSSA